jgi:hypothetical protein
MKKEDAMKLVSAISMFRDRLNITMEDLNNALDNLIDATKAAAGDMDVPSPGEKGLGKKIFGKGKPEEKLPEPEKEKDEEWLF